MLLYYYYEMAIYHLSMKPMSRSSGRSSVAAAAYRAAECLENERDGIVHNFSTRSGVEHAEIVLPASAQHDWANSRSALWNAAEASEKRKDARVAREVEVALPAELSSEQRLVLTREFAQHLADRYGVAVDFAIHSPHGKTDVRNHHAHIMMTTRKIQVDGLGEKSELELENKRLLALGLPTSHTQLREIRISWEERANMHLARAGFENRIDHRSHQDLGLEIAPTQHVGVHATQMERRGKAVSRMRLDDDAKRQNAALILEKPEQVLLLISNEKSVFDRRDIARTLHRYIDGVEDFQTAFARAMASPGLVELRAERRNALTGEIELARYSTREMITVERDMATSADRLLEASGFRVGHSRVERAISIRQQAGTSLSEEQRAAVFHITGPQRIAAVVGLAGAGKSTMLAAAREAWEAEGYRVQGAALAGKAAEGLEESAGISARTLASWSRGWERGFDQLGPRDVFVIDEAGMVGSRQLSQFITEVERTGAKIVLVGDPEQLQPIGAGAAFRAVAERVGFVELEGVRRQREEWQRVASVDFGRHRTIEGLNAYSRQGAVHLEASADHARGAIVRDVIADMDLRPDGSRLVLAHRRVDVQMLNEAIRDARRKRGELAEEVVYRTTEGERAFAPGDRLLFRENNRDLGVKNGSLGVVERTEAGRLQVRLDSAKGPGLGRVVSVSMADYAAVDHGYATTIHKAQGATVDRAYVFASETMDRHLTYVAMTRHRDAVHLYASGVEFRDVDQLSARLSRAQAKETTLDYAGQTTVAHGEHELRQEHVVRAGYAERRGIESDIIPSGLDLSLVATRAQASIEPAIRLPAESLPGLADEPETERVTKKRSMFDGLKLGRGRIDGAAPDSRRASANEHAPQPAAERDAFSGVRLSAAKPQARESGQLEHEAAFAKAVDRYARAWTDVARMNEQGLPILEHQTAALRQASTTLENVRTGATRDLVSALTQEPAIAHAMTALQGRDRVTRLVAGIAHEAQVRRDPLLRAERFVRAWKGLEAQHETRFWRAHEGGPRLTSGEVREAGQRIEASMRALAGELKRDPQLESILRDRGQVLGIRPGSRLDQVMRGGDIDRAIGRGVEHGHDRGRRGPGMSR
jgi:Ti-type conjugative transfer relaxase TraA